MGGGIAEQKGLRGRPPRLEGGRGEGGVGLCPGSLRRGGGVTAHVVLGSVGCQGQFVCAVLRQHGAPGGFCPQRG